jgi:hypothetical protein
MRWKNQQWRVPVASMRESVEQVLSNLDQGWALEELSALDHEILC